MGLRETKKQQTRRAIADAALPLFLERGFDQVSVAEVARHVGVSGQTVFNYFPAKEDLFFDRQAEAEDELAAIVRTREPGRCPVEAVREHVLAELEQRSPQTPAPSEMVRFWQVIEQSAALRARDREIAENTEAALAAELRKDGSFPAPDLLAGAVAGIHRAVERELRRRWTGPGAKSGRDLAESARLAFDTICHGLHPA
ncbi:DNA-binding transcriptional regulator, AcrR family [Nonomuraea maritima]|uniref:DNA-binding transcriptional regulator, AcrR family n=1 Tax=Nonomuraea maritima TaxID=683260 RepID=A0A1G9BKF9_9ACTN|nr:TetR/AcrR family transcriptional regulator [Nonomuraea maritima]SDK40009.1 DNA-binding transcriptional regulator, AcrR family [Nonomuraea maritima]